MQQKWQRQLKGKNVEKQSDDVKKIRPEMLKALTGEGILSSSCVEVWQNFQRLANRCDYSIFKKGDRKQCTSYKGKSLLSLPGNAHAKCPERKFREIVESKLEDG